MNALVAVFGMNFLQFINDAIYSFEIKPEHSLAFFVFVILLDRSPYIIPSKPRRPPKPSDAQRNAHKHTNQIIKSSDWNEIVAHHQRPKKEAEEKSKTTRHETKCNSMDEFAEGWRKICIASAEPRNIMIKYESSFLCLCQWSRQSIKCGGERRIKKKRITWLGKSKLRSTERATLLNTCCGSQPTENEKWKKRNIKHNFIFASHLIIILDVFKFQRISMAISVTLFVLLLLSPLFAYFCRYATLIKMLFNLKIGTIS